ncbi:MAG: S-methyl-5-thioribose-1-phosphate isomerase [Gaiellaceae bacterium]
MPDLLPPYRVVRLEDDRVVLLDQRRLPDDEVELECRSAAEVAEAIRTLAVRGAPAIGVAAAYGYALAAELGHDLDEADRVLRSSRPTAVNLAWALDRMRANPSPEHAREIHAEEVERCRRMAEHAVTLLGPGTRALTHCNTGALATGGYGTALGAIRLGWERGLVEHVWVTETRPLNQGSRLTAWELDLLGITFSVIADSAVASLMEAGRVDIAFTGADRIAANGDTANKIGTYGLAVLARHHDVPFVVIAPTSTVDSGAESGDAIPIEERSAAEVSARFPAFNPAFDITPAELIDAIVTEEGVRRGAPVA